MNEQGRIDAAVADQVRAFNKDAEAFADFIQGCLTGDYQRMKEASEKALANAPPQVSEVER